MTELSKTEAANADTVEPFARFDRLFDEWTQMLPFWRPSAVVGRIQDHTIRVDQYREGDALVIKAEMPGIDPDSDVDVTVVDHVLRISAERREEESVEEDGYVRRELRRGSFSRQLPLPESVTEKDITATYRHGILEIRVPMPSATAAEEPIRIAVRSS